MPFTSGGVSTPLERPLGTADWLKPDTGPLEWLESQLKARQILVNRSEFDVAPYAVSITPNKTTEYNSLQPYLELRRQTTRSANKLRQAIRKHSWAKSSNADHESTYRAAIRAIQKPLEKLDGLQAMNNEEL